MLSTLNEAQKIAAQHIDGPLLILAGAGSGKTKTITTRLAYLISNRIDPAFILTPTLYNKAATEMRERAFSLKIMFLILHCLNFSKVGLMVLKFPLPHLIEKTTL